MHVVIHTVHNFFLRVTIPWRIFQGDFSTILNITPLSQRNVADGFYLFQDFGLGMVLSLNRYWRLQPLCRALGIVQKYGRRGCQTNGGQSDGSCRTSKQTTCKTAVRQRPLLHIKKFGRVPQGYLPNGADTRQTVASSNAG